MYIEITISPTTISVQKRDEAGTAIGAAEVLNNTDYWVQPSSPSGCLSISAVRGNPGDFYYRVYPLERVIIYNNSGA